jgi:N-acetylmuramoyl-L-alanine amidase
MPSSRCGHAALLIFAAWFATAALAASASAALSTHLIETAESQSAQAPRAQAAVSARQTPAPPSPGAAPRPALPAPRQQPSAPPAPAPPVPAPPPRFLIVLDAAHGGDDLGGHLSSGQFEKNATLALSVRLRSLLGARGIQVITTRESDQSVELNQRAEIANHADARACISLHAADTGSGVHLFVSSLTPANPTRFVAWKTAQAGWITRSLALAGVLNSALLHAGTGVTLGRTALPAIDSMTCPAVAIEIAPERDSDHKITAEPDDPDYQARVATTLAAALLEWRTDAGRTEARTP